MPTHEEELGLRLQEEHKALLQLSQVLKQHLATQPSVNLSPWLDGLRIAFDRLQAHIERCITMKTRDGYLRTILQQRPTLGKQVAAIQAEHGQLLRLGEGIRNDLAAARPDDRMLIGDLCARVLRFISVVDQHEQRENMIVLFAFNQDIGGQ
jgi:hemerythrin-like domain-containing protein